MGFSHLSDPCADHADIAHTVDGGGGTLDSSDGERHRLLFHYSRRYHPNWYITYEIFDMINYIYGCVSLAVDFSNKLMPKALDVLLSLVGSVLYLLVAYIAISYYVDFEGCPETKDKISLAKGVVALLLGIIYANMIIVLLFFGPGKREGRSLFEYGRDSYLGRIRESL